MPARKTHAAKRTSSSKRKTDSSGRRNHATIDTRAAELIVHLKSARRSTLTSKQKALASLVEAGIATKKGKLRKVFR